MFNQFEVLDKFLIKDTSIPKKYYEYLNNIKEALK
jgi:hypothetical protein